MNVMISNFSANNMGTSNLWEKSLDVSTQQVTLEWIQSLSPELKDAALLRFCKTVEAKPTMVESFTLNQVLYRTISGGTFTESSENVAERTGCDRKTILKGLKQAVEQNILEENKRPGTSSEYSFKPIEEWLPKPVVHIKDNSTKKVVQFPKIQNTEKVVQEQQLASNDDVVLSTDDHKTDTNVVVVSLKEKEEQQEEVTVHQTDTPSIWRRNPDATRYCQIPPIYDQDTGVEIQRQMDVEGLTAQKVVGRAIALSKVPLMLLELLTNIGKSFANSYLKAQSEPVVTQTQPTEVLVSLELSKTLEIIGVTLSGRLLHKCVCEYGEDVMLNAANELKRTGVLVNKENPTGYFLGCLKNGMGQQTAATHRHKPLTMYNASQDEDEPQSKPKCSTSEMTQSMRSERSFSHVETNPRVTVARLIMDGQYQRAAIVAGLYGVDYEELVKECEIDDPRAIIMFTKVTKK